MKVEKKLHMIGGEGETSYAHNSLLQKEVILKVTPMLEKAMKNVYNKSFPNSNHLAIADLGCSSGPNSLLPISQMIDVIVRSSQESGRSPPEIQLFLNDLPGNDFNSVFKSLSTFKESMLVEKRLESCFISGAPGSFYGRLFPSASLHFVHSSYSLHWLSQVPKGIENNRGNIYLSKTSPNNVFEAYSDQFEKDLQCFLSSRAKEVIVGGQMILTFVGRSAADSSNKEYSLIMEFISKSLLDMANEGFIEEGDIDSFNLPYYTPCIEEVKDIVEKEGSFTINDQIESFEANWDPDDDEENENYEFDKYKSGLVVANHMRAVTESLLASHFGDNVIDCLFAKYAKYVGEHLTMKKTKYVNIVISLTKN